MEAPEGPQAVRIDIINDGSIVLSTPNAEPKFKLHFVLGASQVLFAGFEVLSRVALDQGMGKTAFTFYRNCLAAVVLGGFGVVVERKHWRRLTLKEVLYVFFLGFLGVTLNQLCYLVGLGLTTVMVASAIRNCIPVLTFVMAYFSKLEHIDWRQHHGIAKVVGACLGLIGSVLLTVFKGPVIIAANFSILKVNDGDQSKLASNEHVLNFFTKQIHYTAFPHLGAIFLLVSGFAVSVFFVLQTRFMKRFPAPVTFTSMCCFSSMIQLPFIGAMFEPQWNLWTNIRLGEALSIGYAGLIGSGLVSGSQSWAVQQAGPVVVAAYQPLETLITACLSYFFLRESLHLGTLIGGIIVIFGLYVLVWGQKKEREMDMEIRNNTLPTSRVSPAPTLT